MLSRWRRRGLLCAATVTMLAGGIAAATTATASGDSAAAAGAATTVIASKDHYSATIRRTEFGIPHVRGANFGDLGYGYGYAFAQDNVCAIADLVVTVDGDRSRYFGAQASSGDPFAGQATNLDSDVYHRWINDSGIVGRTLDQPAPLGENPELRQMVAGYVAGVNRYLANTGIAHLPDPTCRAKPWVHPVSTTEIERIAYDVTQISGIRAIQQPIARAVPAASPATPMPVANPSNSGSNGLAVGRNGTANHDGVLLANPHFPWFGAGRLYQVQLTIPGAFDVTGASLYGTPVVEIGHNARIAWTHTVSTAQRFTLFSLHLVPGNPTSYLVDGHAEAMTPHPVSVPLPGGGTETRTVYTSRYGPVVGAGWTSTTAIAIEGASANNGRDLSEWLAMGRADGLAGLRATQNRYQGIPFTNTLAVDGTGTTYFADASVVPNVTDDKLAHCTAAPPDDRFLSNFIVLDGSRSACAWGNAPDAIVPGIFGPGTNPSLTRTDFVTNSNDSFWLTNPAAPITGVPAIYGDTGTARSPRTRMGLTLINDRLHGSDGLGAPGFTMSSMQGLLMSDRNLSAELARDAAVSMCRTNPTLTASDGAAIDVSAACPVLAAWDTRDDPGSRGAVLWRQFWLGAAASRTAWSVPFDPAHPATTPNTLNTADPTVRKALANAVERMRALHRPLDEPLSAAQFSTVGGPDIPAPGCEGNPEGCYNVVNSSTGGAALQDDGRFAPISHGSSFVMAAEVTPHGVTARTILTYSESVNPDSPHHGDQTALFAAKKWVNDRYTEREIRSDPHLTITVLAGH